MNFLDKAISVLSPKMAFERQQYKNALSTLDDATVSSQHYESISYSELIGMTEGRYASVLAKMEAMENSNGLFEGIIKCARDHTIGNGLKAKATISRRIPLDNERIAKIEDELDDYFNSWAESSISDVTNKDNFYELQGLAYHIYKRDGNCFALLPLTKIGDKKIIQVNIIPTKQILGDGFSDGNIETTDTGLPIRYKINEGGKTKSILAFSSGKRNVLHIFKRQQAKQKIGKPLLYTVIKDIEIIDDYMKQELGAAKLSAIFYGSITKKSEDSAFGKQDIDFLNGGEVKTARNTIRQNVITELQPGEELKIHSSGRDNPNYDKFIFTSLQKIATDTRIPIEIILTQFVSSYSASRASMLMMKKFTDPERRLFIQSFCKPVREQVITWGVLNGDLNIPEFFNYRNEILKANWIGDPVGSVDPQKDVRAVLAEVSGNLTTYTEATRRINGGDFEANIQQLKKEQSLILGGDNG